jgi:hypothetical protein
MRIKHARTLILWIGDELVGKIIITAVEIVHKLRIRPRIYPDNVKNPNKRIMRRYIFMQQQISSNQKTPPIDTKIFI